MFPFYDCNNIFSLYGFRCIKLSYTRTLLRIYLVKQIPFVSENQSKEFHRKNSTQVFYLIRPIAVFTDIFNNRFCGCFFYLPIKVHTAAPAGNDRKTAHLHDKRIVDNLKSIRILQLVWPAFILVFPFSFKAHWRYQENSHSRKKIGQVSDYFIYITPSCFSESYKKTMITVSSYSAAIIMCFITMLCWGSWANTQKMVKGN